MSDGNLAMRVHDVPSAVNAEGSHFDVLIIGAGLSGIGATCHLVRKRPGTTFAILEARDAIGGTWDLFRYPAFAQTRICQLSATRSVHGTIRKR